MKNQSIILSVTTTQVDLRKIFFFLILLPSNELTVCM